MKPTDLVTLAADTAAFLRALVSEGVPPQAALKLSETYLQTRMIGNIAAEEPKPPWQPE